MKEINIKKEISLYNEGVIDGKESGRKEAASDIKRILSIANELDMYKDYSKEEIIDRIINHIDDFAHTDSSNIETSPLFHLVYKSGALDYCDAVIETLNDNKLNIVQEIPDEYKEKFADLLRYIFIQSQMERINRKE